MRVNTHTQLAALLFVLSLAGSACAPRASKADSMRQGDQLAEAKRYAEAARAYRRAVTVDPRDGPLRKKLANAAMAAGDWGAAAKEAVLAADLLPDDTEMQLRAASLMLAVQGRFVDAVDRISRFLSQDPDNVEALVVLGNAKAHLHNSTSALVALADVVYDKDKFEVKRRENRRDVSAADDQAAETAIRKALGLSPATTDTQIALANLLWAAGRPDESEELLRKVADQNPTHAPVNAALGQLYLAHQRGPEAEKYLRNAASAGDRSARFALSDYYVSTNRESDARSVLDSMAAADDASGELSLRLSAADARAGKPADAIRRLDTLLVRMPSHALALLLKAQVLFTMGNPDLKYARAAVTAAPQSGDARAMLGRALEATGDLDGAMAEYLEARRLKPAAREPALALARVSAALDLGPKAFEYARDAVQMAPDDQEASLLLVKALVMKPDLGQAELLLKTLLARAPDSPEALVQSGSLQIARGNDATARTSFMRALQFDPDSVGALSGLLSLDLKSSVSGNTQERVEAALASHPHDARYLLLAARLYSAQHDAARTETALRKAVDIDPANLSASTALADFLTRARRPDEARAVLQQIVDRRPRSIEARISLAMILEETGHAADAQALYEQILSQGSQAPTASSRLAWLYLAQGKLDEALGLAVAAKQQRPADPGVSDLLGWIYAQKKLPGLALPHLKDAVNLEPANALYHYHLGCAYRLNSSYTWARAEFTKALEISGTFAGADDARQFLASGGK